MSNFLLKFADRDCKDRGDDVLRCIPAPGQEPIVICMDQKCDGKKDCLNGEDEDDCPAGTANVSLRHLSERELCVDSVQDEWNYGCMIKK